MKNRYYGMRHGQSLANVAQIIISQPENGLHANYGLSELGKQQAKHSAENSGLPKTTLIYTSDFSRALQTAEIVQQVLGAAPLQIREALRERNFDAWEQTSHDNYQKVWDSDLSGGESASDIESVTTVAARAAALILDLEVAHDDADILLVSHGDTLQILQTYFQNIAAPQHRSLTHFETAEIRQF